MTATGLRAIETTVQKTGVWIKELMAELGTDDPQFAYQVLRAVLHTLRDRLLINEAAALGAQLPMLIRGIYYEGWHPAGTPVKERHKEGFLLRVREQFQYKPGIDAEKMVRAVFRVLARRIADGEIEDIKLMLPEELRELWES